MPTDGLIQTDIENINSVFAHIYFKHSNKLSSEKKNMLMNLKEWYLKNNNNNNEMTGYLGICIPILIGSQVRQNSGKLQPLLIWLVKKPEPMHAAGWYWGPQITATPCVLVTLRDVGQVFVSYVQGTGMLK